MSTLLGDLARHQERYAWSWGIIDQLSNFQETHDPDDLPDIPDLPRETVQLLLRPDGQALLDRWVKAFRRSIALMRRFNAERDVGLSFNIADWRLMDDSAAKAVDVIKTSLRNLAEGKNP
jgi:hypothetical protein